MSFMCIITVMLSFYSLGYVEGRNIHHRKQKEVSLVSDPEEQPPPPADSPTVPSDPYPNDPGDSNTPDGIFDVTSFGAVGDGSADDTQAFRAAWKAACAVDSGVILAPANYNFKITSTIFSGPCKPGLVFQVIIFITLLS